MSHHTKTDHTDHLTIEELIARNVAQKKKNMAPELRSSEIRDHLLSYMWVHRNKIRQDLAKLVPAPLHVVDLSREKWFKRLTWTQRDETLKIINKMLREREEKIKIGRILNTNRKPYFKAYATYGNDEFSKGERADRIDIRLQ